MLKINNRGPGMIIGKYNKSVILTYAGVVMAVAGIFIALGGLYIRYAVMLLIVAGICDLFDGKIARACKRTEEEKSFGIQIDSLADMVDFVAFPMILLYRLTGGNRWYHYVIYVVYTLCAVIRLGYFNITVTGRQTEEPVSHYSGLPVTYAAMIFPLTWLAGQLIPARILPDHFFGFIVYPAVMLLTAVAFILNIKIAKPKGAAYIVLILLALAVISYIVFRA